MLAALNLGASGVEVTSVRRRNVRTAMPAPDSVLEEGDVLVLVGTEATLAAAEMKLMQGLCGTGRARHAPRSLR